MSSIGHSVSLHLCGGEIENVALLGRAQACSANDSSCDRDAKGNHESIHQKGCCEDKTVVVDTDKILSKITEKLDVANFLDASIPVVDRIHETNYYSTEEYTHSSTYKPPLIDRDITVLVRSFLI